ncbi:MAG: cbiE [Firmicutes bacterium]|nr:cbiE [Bacillota bacterium]
MVYKITVVGIGPGSPDYLTPVAKRAIDGARVLVGSARALPVFKPAECETKIIDKDLAGVITFISSKLAESDVVVMVSGDPGFYSLLAALKEQFPSDIIKVIPGISSMQLAFARLGFNWQDAEIFSLHGRDPGETDLAYRPQRKIAFLTDGQYYPGRIAQRLQANGWPKTTDIWLCSDLSYENEQILQLNLSEAAGLSGFEYCVMVVVG